MLKVIQYFSIVIVGIFTGYPTTLVVNAEREIYSDSGLLQNGAEANSLPNSRRVPIENLDTNIPRRWAKWNNNPYYHRHLNDHNVNRANSKDEDFILRPRSSSSYRNYENIRMHRSRNNIYDLDLLPKMPVDAAVEPLVPFHRSHQYQLRGQKNTRNHYLPLPLMVKSKMSSFDADRSTNLNRRTLQIEKPSSSGIIRNGAPEIDPIVDQLKHANLDGLIHPNPSNVKFDQIPALDTQTVDKNNAQTIQISDKRALETSLSTAGGSSRKDSELMGYSPFDPRFYQKLSPDDGLKIQSKLRDKAISLLPYRNNDNRLKSLNAINSNNNGDEVSSSKNSGNLEIVSLKPHQNVDSTGYYIIAIVAGVSAATTVGLIAIAIGFYNFHKRGKTSTDIEYPVYGVTGPNTTKDPSPSVGDRRATNSSAHMYHYQHQKQQVLANEKGSLGGGQRSTSDPDSEDENEEGDYTVYECPGLAPTGEMEVKNPLFLDDPTPTQTNTVVSQTSTKTKTNSNVHKKSS